MTLRHFRQAWGGIGDSIVVVGGDGLWNCHIHTNDIGAAIEAGIEVGRPRQIRITDLFEQVEHIESDMLGELVRRRQGRQQDCRDIRSRYSRSHLAEPRLRPRCRLCRHLRGHRRRRPKSDGNARGAWRGVGRAVYESFNRTLAAGYRGSLRIDEVVLLPNNKNIIPVAHQAAEASMSDGAESAKKVLVLETTSIPEGIAALSAYDPQADASENLAAMQAETSELAVGEVTQAVRTTKVKGREISEGDFIAISGGKIVSAAASPADAACELLDEIISPEHELLTLFAGEPADAETTEKLLLWLAENHPHIEAETHDGGQPLYHYYLSLI